MRPAKRVRILVLFALGTCPFYLNGLYNPILAATPKWFWLIDVLTWVVLPVAIYFYGRAQGLFDNREVGLDGRIFGRHRGWPLVLAVLVSVPLCLWFDSILLDVVVRHFPDHLSTEGFDYRQMIPPRGPATGWYRLLALLHLATCAGVVEEFYYRGLLRRVFADGPVSMAAFVLVSSTIFAGSHWEWGLAKLVYTFTWGMVMALAYLAMGNLWPLILGHIAVDIYWLGK